MKPSSSLKSALPEGPRNLPAGKMLLEVQATRITPFESLPYTRPRSSTVHLLCSNYRIHHCTHHSAAMLLGNVKENDPSVAWHGLQRVPNHPNSGGRGLLVRVSVTRLEVPVRRNALQVWFPARSCNSQSFFPMNCLWRTGMQESMAYQLFGRRSP